MALELPRWMWVGSLIGTVCAATAAGQQPSASAERIALERRWALGVDPGRAVRRVRELVALGPRMGGTPSGERAAAYLEAALRESGVDTRVVRDPEKDAWEAKSWSLKAHRGAQGGETFVFERAWPWIGSPSAAGRCELALESRAEAGWLTDKRARGRGQSQLVLLDGSVTLDGAYPVAGSLGPDAPQPCFGISRSEGARLREWLSAGERVEIEYALEAWSGRAQPATVLARLRPRGAAPGADWNGDYLLFCAHGDSDSGGPGANDNASGVAVLLEIASAWQAALNAGEAPTPPCEIRFAIWGSEIFSTRDYLAKRIPSEGRCLGVINYDQAGFGSGADQLNIEPDDLPANAALVRTLLAVLSDHADAAAGEARLFPERWATNRSLGGTDSYVFSASQSFAQSSTPALTLFASAWGAPAEHRRTEQMPGESWRERDKVSVDYDAHYHSSGDLPANTTDKEPWNMAWCARIGWLGAARFAETLASPTSSSAPAEKKK